MFRFLRNIFNNLKFLVTQDIEKFCLRTVAGAKYIVVEENSALKITSPESTLLELVNSAKSICRFGDGEFSLIFGKRVPAQQRNAELSNRLREILKSQDPDIMIGIPRVLFHRSNDMTENAQVFFDKWGVRNAQNVIDSIDKSKVYYDSGCTIMYANYQGLDCAPYFELARRIWDRSEIAIICGQTVFDKIEHNIFDNAKSVEYIFAPPKNAFSQYRDILQKAGQIDKGKMVIVILGATATVLSYDLAKKGYRALDLGHIAKDYDYFMKQFAHSGNSVTNFFAPD